MDIVKFWDLVETKGLSFALLFLFIFSVYRGIKWLFRPKVLNEHKELIDEGGYATRMLEALIAHIETSKLSVQHLTDHVGRQVVIDEKISEVVDEIKAGMTEWAAISFDADRKTHIAIIHLAEMIMLASKLNDVDLTDVLDKLKDTLKNSLLPPEATARLAQKQRREIERENERKPQQ
jgi:hypothetical protein